MDHAFSYLLLDLRLYILTLTTEPCRTADAERTLKYISAILRVAGVVNIFLVNLQSNLQLVAETLVLT